MDEALVAAGSRTTRRGCSCSRLPSNLANFLRRVGAATGHQALVADDAAGEVSSKIGARVVRHAGYVTFQLAEVAVPRKLFAVCHPASESPKLRLPETRGSPQREPRCWSRSQPSAGRSRALRGPNR